jgi:hypothetical protein
MVSKSLKVVAIIIVLAVIFSGVVYLILPPPITASEAMILTPEEIGPGWMGAKGMPDGTSMSGEISRSEWGFAKNTSLDIRIQLIVFNSTEKCDAAFKKVSFVYASAFNCTEVPIGDKAIRIDYVGAPIYLFVRENVLCWTIDFTFGGYPPQPWHDSALLIVAGLQLQKIDQYLAQHPGAS